jgi:hypothetical protein
MLFTAELTANHLGIRDENSIFQAAATVCINIFMGGER